MKANERKKINLTVLILITEELLGPFEHLSLYKNSQDKIKSMYKTAAVTRLLSDKIKLGFGYGESKSDVLHCRSFISPVESKS